MKMLLFWIVLFAAVATAASLAVVHFKKASTALQEFVSPGPLSPRHKYLADKCASCHETNIGVTAAKCTVCHANAERLLGRQPSSFHASVRECRTCHVEHQGTNIRPVVMDHVELAKIGGRILKRASRGNAASAEEIKSLETWLRIRVPGQFDDRTAREALNCAGCHSTIDRHLGLFGNDCASCHLTASWRIAGYQHPSPSSFNCAQCHQAPGSHYMMHFDMISKKIAGQEDEKVAGCCGAAQVRQCFRCHQTTSWNDIRGVGYYKHH